MGSKLYVGNLSYQTTEDALRNAFGDGGRQVRSVAIIMDRETGRSKGFAFVEMDSEADAQAAMKALDGHELDGRALRVNEAQERAPRPRFGGGAPGPGGGGGGGGGPGGPGGPGGGYGGMNESGKSSRDGRNRRGSGKDRDRRRYED